MALICFRQRLADAWRVLRPIEREYESKSGSDKGDSKTGKNQPWNSSLIAMITEQNSTRAYRKFFPLTHLQPSAVWSDKVDLEQK